MIETNVAIVGAGPIGLELAVALKQLGVDYAQFDAAQIGHTVSWYPRNVRFFSSPDRIAIAGVPLNTPDQSKATREQYLSYLRGICQMFDLTVHTFERIIGINKTHGGFILTTKRKEGERTWMARHIVLAIGDMHRPARLDIPGEDLPHVAHYFDDPHRYFRKQLLIVGGRNSAVEAAIRCQRIGAHVTLSYRQNTFDTNSIKYWLHPELKVMISTGQIVFHPSTIPTEITTNHVHLQCIDGSNSPDVEVAADFVLLLTGYKMDTTLFQATGITMEGETQSPKVNPKTMETNVTGIYVIGTAVAGTQKRFRLFIENCHAHVGRIVKAITGSDCPFSARDVTTSDKYRLPES